MLCYEDVVFESIDMLQFHFISKLVYYLPQKGIELYQEHPTYLLSFIQIEGQIIAFHIHRFTLRKHWQLRVHQTNRTKGILSLARCTPIVSGVALLHGQR